jgi:hypothetical protein
MNLNCIRFITLDASLYINITTLVLIIPKSCTNWQLPFKTGQCQMTWREGFIMDVNNFNKQIYIMKTHLSISYS